MKNKIQINEEKMLVDKLGEGFFKTPKEQFSNMPKNMSAKEYKEWRKLNKSK